MKPLNKIFLDVQQNLFVKEEPQAVPCIEYRITTNLSQSCQILEKHLQLLNKKLSFSIGGLMYGKNKPQLLDEIYVSILHISLKGEIFTPEYQSLFDNVNEQIKKYNCVIVKPAEYIDHIFLMDETDYSRKQQTRIKCESIMQ